MFIDPLLKLTAQALLKVEDLNNPELAEKRYHTCLRCSNFDHERKVCNACGCFMEIKSKLKTHRNPVKGRVEVTHCPFGLWGDIKIANHYREIDGLSLLQVLSHKEFNNKNQDNV